MTMTTSEVVREFCGNHATEGSASNNRLRIEGDELINYSTTIAFRHEGRIVLNNTKYSSTTSRHQNRIRQYSHYECNEETLNELINARTKEAKLEVFSRIKLENRKEVI